MGGGPTVSSNIGRICSETIFQKVFVRIARTGRVFRGEVGNERSTLSLSLAERNRDTAETEYGGNTTRRKSLTSIRLDGR